MSVSGSWNLRVVPRGWQLAAVERWKARMQGIVKVVTGAGKTVLAEMCLLAFREKFREGRCIVVVPTVALLDQWFVSLQEDLGVQPDQIASYSGEGRSQEPRLINLVVVNTARQVGRELSAGSDNFLIVDECHRLGSPVNSLALEGRHRATLGLSATPEREQDEGLYEHLIPTLGELIYTYDYVQAHRDGVIVPFSLVNVQIDLLPQEQRRYDGLTRSIAREFQRVRSGDVLPDNLKVLLRRRAAISAAAAARVPVAVKIAERHSGQRTLIFHERVPAANAIYRLLVERNASATLYHSLIGSNIRRDNLRLYRRGVFDVLVCCRALDEGTNVPETSVAIIASSTASSRQRIQRFGRVLRPAPGKIASNIYTIYGTSAEEERLRREEAQLQDVAEISWFRAEGIRRG